MNGSNQGKVTFEYQVSPNFNVYAISGIQGGFNAQGELIANFFHERSPIPKKTTYALQEDESLGEEIEREASDAITRHVIFGISMNPRIARYMARWFNNKAEEYERAIGNIPENDNNNK